MVSPKATNVETVLAFGPTFVTYLKIGVNKKQLGNKVAASCLLDR